MKRVLFLGEGSLDGPARYLAGILRWARIPFDHLPDQTPIPQLLQKRQYSAFILSDYRHRGFTQQSERWLTEGVRQGSGLLMIGGWASFTGLVGHYKGTLIESLLPVRCVAGDDRVNCPSGAAIGATPQALAVFPRLGLSDPPVVCGYHRLHPLPGSQTLLTLRDLQFNAGRPALGRSHPLLVTSKAGLGRTAAFLTDCAPHWAGGLVDWGRKRVNVRVKPGVQVEVGDTYLMFFAQLIRWVGNSIR